MPKGYKFCLLKNEFGDVKVDSQIAKLANIDVQEMTNGCLCCVLVGQMKEGLLELREKYNPDRIIIETSGSAFPGTPQLMLYPMNCNAHTLRLLIQSND